MDNLNHELVEYKFSFLDIKIFKCKKCHYKLSSFPSNNFKLCLLDNTESLSCEEMQIKKLLE